MFTFPTCKWGFNIISECTGYCNSAGLRWLHVIHVIPHPSTVLLLSFSNRKASSGSFKQLFTPLSDASEGLSHALL